MANRQVHHYVADTETNAPKTTLYGETYDEGEDHHDIAEWIRRAPQEYNTNEPDHEAGSGYRSATAADLAELEEESDTRVWRAALCPVMENPDNDDVLLQADIAEFISVVRTLPSSSIVWFHNLAYDISYLLTALNRMGYQLSDLGMPPTEEEINKLNEMRNAIPETHGRELRIEEYEEIEAQHDAIEKYEEMLHKREKDVWRKPKAGTYSAVVSDSGVWYSLRVTFHNGNRTIEFRDSMKMLPFSLDAVAASLKTKAQKLTGTIDYTKNRPVGYVATEEEDQYVINDVLVASEALYKVSNGPVDLTDGLTIGGACMKELYRVWGGGDMKAGRKLYRDMMPVVPPELDEELRKAYKGGLCINYTDGEIVGEMDGVKRGHTLDVNSLYPAVMYNHRYPIGDAAEVDPREFPKIQESRFEWIVRFSAHFEVKPDHVPFIQDKSTIFGDQTHITDSLGMKELTLTKPDYDLFLEQYTIFHIEIDKLWVWESSTEIFNKYVEKWYETKSDSRKAGDKVTETIAKLMLNNPYGKMSQAPERGSGRPYMSDEGIIKYESVISVSEGGFIPVGAYITAYARAVTVRAAQQIINSGRRFLYADTDSVHFIGDLDGLDISIGKELGQWDHEGSWDTARFVRQKTYIEHILTGKGDPYLDIKAAGAPGAVKERLLYDVTDITEDGPIFRRLEKDGDTITSPKRDKQQVIDRFKPGLVESGKLRRKSVVGGTQLEETTFRIHEPG